MRGVTTDIHKGQQRTSEPYGRTLDGGEDLTGGEEEISADGVGRGGRLKKNVSG
jgi:hypothetical protein